MNSQNITELRRGIKDGGHEFIYLRTGIIAAYYITSPIRDIGKQLAEVVRQYVRFVGSGALTHFAAENGTFKPLTDKRLRRDLALLEALPQNPDLSWEYSSVGDGGVGDYRIRLFASDADADFPSLAGLLRLEFPSDAVAHFGTEILVQFIAAVAGTLRVQSAHAGWGFKRAEPFATEARRDINTLLPRYLGFDPGFDMMALTMRNCCAPAHWINFIDEHLLARCGGADGLRQTEPNARVDVSGGVTMIRASLLPPLGDSNLGAPDLGCIPGVARFLQPVRVQLAGLGDDRFDVRSWLARFDDLPSRAWEN